MTIRFFILQAHYRSTVDFSNEALIASEKGLQRLIEAFGLIKKLNPWNSESSGFDIKELQKKCYDAMNDDLNTPMVISYLAEAARFINSVYAEKARINVQDLQELEAIFRLFLFDILGVQENEVTTSSTKNELAYQKVVDLLLEQRVKAKENKDWTTSDYIRDQLTELGFEIKDTRNGFEWKLNL